MQHDRIHVAGHHLGGQFVAPWIEIGGLYDRLAEAVRGGPDSPPVGVTHHDDQVLLTGEMADLLLVYLTLEVGLQFNKVMVQDCQAES